MLKSPSDGEAGPTAIVWLADGHQVDASSFHHWCNELGPAEATRLGRFIRPERRAQYVLGRMLLRRAVSHFTGLPAKDISVVERAGNSPLLKLPDGCLSPSFSISHSGQWVACAASRDTPLGLDIEATGRQRDFVRLAEAAFSGDERQYVMEADGDEQLARFYRVWTTREALIKLESAQGRNVSLADVASPRGLHAGAEAGWATALAHPHLCITLCAARALQDVQLRDIALDQSGRV